MNGFIALVNIILTGFFLHPLLKQARLSRQTVLAAIPTIFGLGSAGTYLFFIWGSWLGDVSLAALQMLIIALGIGWLFLRQKRTIRAESYAWRNQPGELLIFMVISLLICINLSLTISLPILDWDTRILWALKAKLLTLEPSIGGEAFRDPYRLHIHPRYPLLVPFLSSWMARLQGAFLESHYQALISIFALLTTWQLYMLLARLTERKAALSLTAVMACTGAWMNAQYNSGIEIALTFFLVLSINYLLAWEAERKTADMLMAAIFLFGTAMVKNEGVLLVACSCSALFTILLLKNDIRSAVRSTAFLAGIFLILSAGWLAHLIAIPAVSDEQYLSRLTPAIVMGGLQRLPAILHTLLTRMADLRQWHLLWLTPLVTFIAVLLRKKSPERRLLFVAIMIACYCTGLLLIYVISPWRDIVMHINVTFDRITLPLLPLFILLLALALPATRQNDSSGDPA